jgi:glycosyltransferase involved in cell wall biosynthesis
VTPDRVQALRDAWGIEARDGRVKLLLAGRLTRLKGHLTIVEAAARLKAEGRDFVIIFAGDDQGRTGYREEIEAAVAAAGLGDKIKLVGHCDDMPAAYLACDVAMLPSTQPESFGRTAVEPQVMGRPVLASDHGGTAETVVHGETGWLVKAGDAEAWANAMGRAIDAGRARLAAMGQAAANRARQLYSVDAMCAATLAAYARVLDARAQR